MYRRITVLAVAIFLTFLTSSHAQEGWVGKNGGMKNTELKGAVLSGDTLYIATRNILYKASDARDGWVEVFGLPSGGNNEITCVAGRGRAMFIGTKRGLFRSDDYAATWKNVFRTLLPDKNNITCIELSRHAKGRILIGTEKGIFLSEDLGAKWQDISGVLKNTAVKCLALNKELMYAGTENGLYVMRAGFNGWERVFIKSPAEKKETDEEESYGELDDGKDMSVRAIAVSDGRSYAACDKDILYSDDGAKTWKNFSSEGIKGAINYILVSQKNKKIYCATVKGVFEFSEEKSRWFELYKGMSRNLDVNKILFGSEDEKTLLAATDKGLYTLQGGDYLMDKYPDVERSLKTLKVAFDGEPTFKELQQAAIKYAEVDPEKIKKWRAGAQARALLPKISFGIDRNTTDLWHWEGGSTTKENDDILRPGRDTIDWDAAISWELGDLIWSTDQTSIDVRSRLMVQLRNDILDDLRRAYYERKRLQIELMANPPKDPNAKIEKELRMRELTQAIDDLTGNYFSEHMKEKP